jgi:hypothetical protein
VQRIRIDADAEARRFYLIARRQMKKAKSTLESYARPYLGRVRLRAKEEGRRPCDYVLLIGKYEPTSSALLPRAEGDELLKLAKTPIQREKLERYLAEPCAETKVLVLVTAGEHVEAAQVTVLMEPREPSAPVAISQKERDQIDAYLKHHTSTIVSALDLKGERLADFVVVAPTLRGVPAVLRRTRASETLEAMGFGPVLAELHAPAANDDELLWFYKVSDTPTWSKMQMTAAATRR